MSPNHLGCEKMRESETFSKQEVEGENNSVARCDFSTFVKKVKGLDCQGNTH